MGPLPRQRLKAIGRKTECMGDGRLGGVLLGWAEEEVQRKDKNIEIGGEEEAV